MFSYIFSSSVVVHLKAILNKAQIKVHFMCMQFIVQFSEDGV